MKSLITYLCCFLFVLSSLLMGASLYAINFDEEELLKKGSEPYQMEEKINSLLSFVTVKEEDKARLDEIASTVANHPKLTQALSRYRVSVVSQLLNGAKVETSKKFDAILLECLLPYAEELVKMSNDAEQGKITTIAEMEMEMRQAVNNMDFNTNMHTLTINFYHEMPSTMRLLLKIMVLLESSGFFWGMLALNLLSAFFILVCNIQWLNGFVPLAISCFISAGLLLLAAKMAPYAMKMLVFNNENVMEAKSQAFLLFAIGDGLIFLILSISKFLYNRNFDRN